MHHLISWLNQLLVILYDLHLFSLSSVRHTNTYISSKADLITQNDYDFLYDDDVNEDDDQSKFPFRCVHFLKLTNFHLLYRYFFNKYQECECDFFSFVIFKFCFEISPNFNFVLIFHFISSLPSLILAYSGCFFLIQSANPHYIFDIHFTFPVEPNKIFIATCFRLLSLFFIRWLARPIATNEFWANFV